MAIGDKKNVVMESDKGIAGGVATLGSDGILAPEQRPSADGLFMADGVTKVEDAIQAGMGDMKSSVYDPHGKAQDIFAYVDDKEVPVDAVPTEGSGGAVSSGGTYDALANKADLTFSNVTETVTALENIGAADNNLSNLPAPATAVYNLGAASNPNLLDNWYFADPIDQRGGRVVPPGITSYSDSSLTTPNADVTSAYYGVNVLKSEYAQFMFEDSTTGYIPAGDTVRGYARTSSGYSIDRWYLGSGNVLLPVSGGVKLIARGAESRTFRQILEEPGRFAGLTVTASVLVTELDAGAVLNLFVSANGTSEKLAEITSPGLYSGEVTLPSPLSELFVNINSTGGIGTGGKLAAVKLEIGGVQTLAHWDETAQAWVLNDPPPDRQQALARCQRFQIRPTGRAYQPGGSSMFVRADRISADSILFTIPQTVSMRAAPAVVKLYGADDDALWIREGVEDAESSTQTGFTFTVGCNSDRTLMRITAAKTAHGLHNPILGVLNVLFDANL